MNVPTASSRTQIPSGSPSTSRRRVSKYDLLQTVFDPSRLLVFPHPDPEAAVQAYLASLDAAHLYWDGVSSLPDYLLSIGVRKEGLDELVEILEAEHPGLLRSISVEHWVMGFLEQDEAEDEKAYQDWVEAELKCQQKDGEPDKVYCLEAEVKRQEQDSDAGNRISEEKELAESVGETGPATSVHAGLASVVV